MIRALIELVFAIVVLIAARAILTTVLKGLLTLNSAVAKHENAAQQAPNMPPGRELHKDPVCGTYVVESTPFRRQLGPTTFYYCSEQCLQRHSVEARRA